MFSDHIVLQNQKNTAMNIFTDTSVTVIRKRDDEYFKEKISTATILPSCKLSDEQNRINTIDRLRRDPSVVFVLEDRGGMCEEHAVLANGFEMAISIRPEGEPAASITVFYENNAVCKKTFALETEENAHQFLQSFLGEVMCLLRAIDRRDYYFVDDDCPFFEEDDPVFSPSLYDVCRMLDEAGYQCEEIQAVDLIHTPCLFVHENDIVLVGSKRFAGESLFVEMKRLFVNRSAAVVEKAIAKYQEDSEIEVIPWHDGSWSFRLPFEDDLEEEDVVEQILSIVSTLKEFIRKVERNEDLYESGDFEMEQIRQFFIYENIDTALKLSRLPI